MENLLALSHSSRRARPRRPPRSKTPQGVGELGVKQPTILTTLVAQAKDVKSVRGIATEEGAFSLSLVRHGAIRPDSIRELKTGMLKRGGLIQLHRGGERFALPCFWTLPARLRYLPSCPVVGDVPISAEVLRQQEPGGNLGNLRAER